MWRSEHFSLSILVDSEMGIRGAAVAKKIFEAFPRGPSQAGLGFSTATTKPKLLLSSTKGPRCDVHRGQRWPQAKCHGPGPRTAFTSETFPLPARSRSRPRPPVSSGPPGLETGPRPAPPVSSAPPNRSPLPAPWTRNRPAPHGPRSTPHTAPRFRVRPVWRVQDRKGERFGPLPLWNDLRGPLSSLSGPYSRFPYRESLTHTRGKV